MKIIDLLNKIANGEEVPNIVQTNDGDIFYYDETDDNELMRYKNKNDIPIIDEFYLNEEVEILNIYKVETLEEEKKIPEKLNIDKEHNRLFKKDGSYWSIKAH